MADHESDTFDPVGSAAVAADYPRPWRRIADDLRQKIVDGRWQPGDRLPTQHELQEEYEADGAGSRGVIQRVLGQLSDEGYIVTMRGSGSRVAPRESWPTEEDAGE